MQDDDDEAMYNFYAYQKLYFPHYNTGKTYPHIGHLISDTIWKNIITKMLHLISNSRFSPLHVQYGYHLIFSDIFLWWIDG